MNLIPALFSMTIWDPASWPVDWHWLWLAVAAFLAGVLNAVAGGGSFLLFPALLGMRMLPVQANATNTVALWPGQMTSVWAYWEEIKRNRRLAPTMGLAGLLGGTAGAVVLLNTPQQTFMRLVPWLLLVAASIFAASGPVSRWLAGRRQAEAGADSEAGTEAGVAQDAGYGPEAGGTQVASVGQGVRLAPVFVATMLVCFYIGYFGAGAGFLIITVLSLFGFNDLNEINALKVVSTTMANGMAFVIFVVNGQVEWRYCLLAMATCAVGGYTSARFARMVPQAVLRGTVIAIGFGMAAWFFWKG
jgi:uncharacterized membrane protein YfcA